MNESKWSKHTHIGVYNEHINHTIPPPPIHQRLVSCIETNYYILQTQINQ